MTAAALDFSTISLAPPAAVDKTVRWGSVLLLALIVIAAAMLRFVDIGGPVYELDEFWHAELSTGRGSAHNHQPLNQLYVPGPKVTGLKGAPPWWRVWSHMDDTVHPPLYPLALRLWRASFGEDEGASRSLGAAASVLSILLLFDVARRLHGTSAALWASAIMAVASPQIALARTLRGYTFGLMLLLCVAVVLIRLEQEPNKHRVLKLGALFIFALGSMLTHYFTLFVLAAVGLYVVIRLRGAVRWGAIAALVLALLAFVAVWGPGMYMQRNTLPSPNDLWIADGWTGHLRRTWTWAASLPLRMLFEPRQTIAPVAILGASLYIIPILFLRRRPDLLLWVLWLWLVMTPLLVMDLMRETKHLSYIRYTLAAGPAVFALLAALLLHMPKVTMRHVVPLVSLIACVLSIGSAYEEPRLRYDWMAEVIDANRKPGEPVIIVSPPTNWYGNAIFLTLSHESSTYPWPVVMLNRWPIDPTLLRQLRRSGPGAWLISEAQSPIPTHIVPGARLIPQDTRYVPRVAFISHVVFDEPK